MIKLQTKFEVCANSVFYTLELIPEVQDFVTSMHNLNESGKYEIDLNGEQLN